MRLNIKAQCYTDAIFYADKIVNMLRSRECPVNSSPSVEKGLTGQAAAPAGGNGSFLNGDSSNQSLLNKHQTGLPNS